jgi:group I intron endonuclease
MKKSRGIIYKVSSPSGKVYIGQTIFSLERRKQRHFSDSRNVDSKSYNLKLAKAIRKYGENLKWEVLHVAFHEELDELEILEISNHNSRLEGYNCTFGGEGGRGHVMSEDGKKRISEFMIGKVPWNKGIPRKESVKRKISLSRMGQKPSEETKKKLSKARQGRYSGENNPMYGKKHSEETKRKMREAHAKR